MLTSVLAVSASWADPVRVFAAGSLVGPVKEMIAASGLPKDVVADPVFGPAGLLGRRIAGGEKTDLFLSADLAQPRRLAEAGRTSLVVPFARNRMCVIAKVGLGLTPETLLDRLLAPDLRLATSTPVADPGGDYALAVFARADAIRPGAGQILRDKALKLLGSPDAMVPVAGRSASASVFLADRADALLYYCSGQVGTMREAPGLALTQLPLSLAVPVAEHESRIRTITEDRVELARRLRLVESLQPRPENPARPASPEAADQEAVIAGLRERVARAETNATSQADRRAALTRAVEALTAELRLSAEREAELRGERDGLEATLGSTLAGAEPSEVPGDLRAEDTPILYVGGRPRQVAAARNLIERRRGTLLSHNGGVEDSTALLPGLVAQAELVLVPVDCISHTAALLVKRCCRDLDIRFVPLRTASLASIIGTLDPR